MQEKGNENVVEIDLEELFGLLLKKSWIIVLSGVVMALIALAASAFVVTPKYKSTTGIYVMNKQDSGMLTYSDAQLSSQLTKDYEELIASRYVMETVISRCGLKDEYEDLQDRVTIENATDTRIIYVSVKDKDPAMAQLIANSIREVASEHIKAVTDVEAVNVVDEANLPLKPSEPSIPLWTVIGALLGLVVSTSVIVTRYLLDDTIKSSEDIERYLGWSTLALIPVIAETTAEKKPVTKKEKVSVRQDEEDEPLQYI